MIFYQVVHFYNLFNILIGKNVGITQTILCITFFEIRLTVKRTKQGRPYTQYFYFNMKYIIRVKRVIN